MNLRYIDAETREWMIEFARKNMKKNKGLLSFTLNEAIKFLKENPDLYLKWKQEKIRKFLFMGKIL